MRRLMVTTGLEYPLPDAAESHEQWRQGVVVWPCCDGWEQHNDVIGVVGTFPRGVEPAQEWRQWSDRKIYFENVVGETSTTELDWLAHRGILVEPGVVS